MGRPRRGLRATLPRPLPLLLASIAGVELVRLVLWRGLADLVVLALLMAAWFLVARDTDWARDAEAARETEAESFARMLRGLARSVSPDAIVGAIVEELGAGTEADHVSVVRRRPESRNLEAVLSPTRPGAPASRTYLPLSVLEDPALDGTGAEGSPVAARGRRYAAVPIEPDAEVDPQLVGLGLARSRPVLAAVDGRASRDVPGWGGGSRPSGAGLGSRPPVAALPEAAPMAASRRWTAAGHASPPRAGAGQRIADRIADRLRTEYGLRNVLAAPLRVDGRVEGAIVLSRRTRKPWAPRAHRLLVAAAFEASAALARIYTLRDAELRAATDALTGLPNRRYFDEYLGLLARRRRADDRVGVLMVDIDRFKRLNDTYGHAVGDQLLVTVSRTLQNAVRSFDFVGRWGGEEFLMCLPNVSDVKTLGQVVERFRVLIAASSVTVEGKKLSVTASFGATLAQREETPDAVFKRADGLLYRSKEEGRNRVTVG